MRLLRHAALAALVLATAVTTAGPAFAAPAGNDTYPGRTVVGSVPFAETVDTTEATTDADDAEINAQCGAPMTDASVWYQLTAATDGGMVVDVSQSTYSAGAIVATGGPGNWTVQACAPGTVGFTAVAGETYTILAIDDQYDGGGNGGTLNIKIDHIPPPPTIDITVNKFASFDPHSGSATVSGTVTCTSDASWASLDTFLRQQVGRLTTISGWGSTSLVCDGTAQSWSAWVYPDSGKFAGGKAASVSFALACGVFDCGFDYVERTVQLRG